MRGRMFLEADAGRAVALIKLRQFAEFIAREVATSHGLLHVNNVSFDEVLRLAAARDLRRSHAPS